MAQIRIILQSDLCAGSGKSFGNVVDADFSADRLGLPVISGRSIKGCLRQAAERLKAFRLTPPVSEDDVIKLFGNSLGQEGAFSVSDATTEYSEAVRRLLRQDGPLLSSSDLAEWARTNTQPGSVADLFGYVRGQTRIEDGIAKAGTLRFTRVVSRYSPTDEERPLELTAKVTPPKDPALEALLERCCKAVRHIGMHRNRGLGMIRMIYEKTADDEAAQSAAAVFRNKEEATVAYGVALDANLVMNGIAEPMTFIPGRSVIGCMAAAYCKEHRGPVNDDPTFRDLFLSGRVRWSDLTPVIDGVRTEPAPLMLAYLRNQKRYINLLAADEADRKEKRKAVEGVWAAAAEDGYRIAEVPSEIAYHHRHKNEEGQDAMLYSHASLSSHLLYAGTVTVPPEYVDTVLHLLDTAKLRFGHSKNAQYATCSVEPLCGGKPAASDVAVRQGEKVYLVLGSDTVLTGPDGRYLTDPKEIRQQLIKALHGEAADRPLLRDAFETDDCIQLHMRGGYHAMWQMQRLQVPAICGGSVFCFAAEETAVLPKSFSIGESRQEGFGVCHLVPESVMRKRISVTKHAIQTARASDAGAAEAEEAFAKALLAYEAKRSVSQSAVRIWEKIRGKKDLTANLNNGRIRLMVEDAKDLADLRSRIESIKTDSSRKAGKAFLDAAYPDGDENTRIARLLCGNESIQQLASYLPETFWNENWKQLLLDVLHLHAYAAETDGKDGADR